MTLRATLTHALRVTVTLLLAAFIGVLLALGV